MKIDHQTVDQWLETTPEESAKNTSISTFAQTIAKYASRMGDDSPT